MLVECDRDNICAAESKSQIVAANARTPKIGRLNLEKNDELEEEAIDHVKLLKEWRGHVELLLLS